MQQKINKKKKLIYGERKKKLSYSGKIKKLNCQSQNKSDKDQKGGKISPCQYLTQGCHIKTPCELIFEHKLDSKIKQIQIKKKDKHEMKLATENKDGELLFIIASS